MRECANVASPPFSPEETVADFADRLRRYGIRTVVGDKFGGEWPAERFRTHRIAYAAAAQTKAQLYGELLPLLTSQAVQLVDDRRLVAQLLALERRTAWGGRDTIDHPPGGHDDVANAAAGALVLAAANRRDRRGPRLALGGCRWCGCRPRRRPRPPRQPPPQRPWRWPPDLWLPTPRDRPSEGP